MTTTNQMEVANEIRNQVGRQGLFMLGAKNLIALDSKLGGLTFKIGRNAKKVTHVTIILDGSDTYDVRFQRVWGAKVTTIAEFDGVYADMLRELIETNTGMYLSL